MAYAAPYIDASGPHYPTYADIVEFLVGRYLQINGQANYLGADSADYQFISAIALAISDTHAGSLLSYNNRSPQTAVGSGLDGILKLSAITRKQASNSTVQVTLSGTAGAVVTNGLVQDINNYLWALPSSVTISGGSVTVTAVCQTPGHITANIGDVAKIATPTAGWVSVTNSVPAVAGQSYESDSVLRARQAISVALPAFSMIDSLRAGVAAVLGVTRYNVVENPTGSTDSLGNPAHSITAVVEGGTDADVAYQIKLRKGVGPYTNGTTEVDVTDPYTANVETIRFLRPTYVPIYATLAVKALSGYTSATTAAIKQTLTDYLNSLQIGEDVTISALYAVAMAVSPNLQVPLFSITSLKADTSASPATSTDIAIDFDSVSEGIAANIIINVS